MAFPNLLQQQFIEKLAKRVYVEAVLGFKEIEDPEVMTNAMMKDEKYHQIKTIITEEIEERDNPGGHMKY